MGMVFFTFVLLFIFQNLVFSLNLRKINDISNDEIQKTLTVMLVGDYGTTEQLQEVAAVKLNEVSEEINAEFILGMGDNFYNPNGVFGVEDPSWETHWANVYQKKSYLKNLKWYGTIGNHDYGNVGLYSEFKYRKYGWVIEDFFWTHTAQVDGVNIAFVHVDTSFLAYGVEGQSTKEQMKYYFIDQGWVNDDQILDLVEQQLKKYKNYDWIIAMGHHHVGYSCYPVLNTGKLVPLFEKYNVDAYLSGHSHSLSYSQNNGMAYALSGAAGGEAYDNECAVSNPFWSKGMVLGFMGMEISQDLLTFTAYYREIESDQEDWKTLTFPSSKRKEKI